MVQPTVLKIVYLKENQGHGYARRRSLAECKNELVALMDADDVSLPGRFEKQLSEFALNSLLDVCGGQITEFVGSEDNIICKREVKLTDEEIKRDLQKRCPMNQVTVMFKKKAYDSAGGYIDWFCEEDYYLWARMAKNNSIFANVKDSIVNVRVGLEMSSRRGGWNYFKSEKRMQKYLYKNGIISLPRYLHNVAIRFFGEVLTPNFLRNQLFKLVRKKPSREVLGKLEHKQNERYSPFSVAMCVYGGDNPLWFDRALESVIIKQTVRPSEVVIVVDGPISNPLQEVIDKYADICSGI